MCAFVSVLCRSMCFQFVWNALLHIHTTVCIVWKPHSLYSAFGWISSLCAYRIVVLLCTVLMSVSFMLDIACGTIAACVWSVCTTFDLVIMVCVGGDYASSNPMACTILVRKRWSYPFCEHLPESAYIVSFTLLYLAYVCADLHICFTVHVVDDASMHTLLCIPCCVQINTHTLLARLVLHCACCCYGMCQYRAAHSGLPVHIHFIECLLMNVLYCGSSLFCG